MIRVALILMILAVPVQAGPFGLFSRRGGGSGGSQATTGGGFATAQDAANHMARIGRIGHFGGNSGYEGVGMGSTPDQAMRNCCYFGRFAIRDHGCAQGANGMWFACNRY